MRQAHTARSATDGSAGPAMTAARCRLLLLQRPPPVAVRPAVPAGRELRRAEEQDRRAGRMSTVLRRGPLNSERPGTRPRTLFCALVPAAPPPRPRRGAALMVLLVLLPLLCGRRWRGARTPTSCAPRSSSAPSRRRRGKRRPSASEPAGPAGRRQRRVQAAVALDLPLPGRCQAPVQERALSAFSAAGGRSSHHQNPAQRQQQRALRHCCLPHHPTKSNHLLQPTHPAQPCTSSCRSLRRSARRPRPCTAPWPPCWACCCGC